MNNLLNSVGVSEDIYIDFAEDCYGLLQKLALSLRDGTAASALLATFNDYAESMGIITYFKVCSSVFVAVIVCADHRAAFDKCLDANTLSRLCRLSCIWPDGKGVLSNER